jgi:hypothetical protein
VSGSQGTANHVSPCSVDRFCSRDICDPTIVFGDLGERLGTCRTVDISATQCPPDAFLCASNACDETQDKCVQTDTSAKCGTSDACVERGCNPDTGCFTIDHTAACGTSDACVERGCNTTTGCFTIDHTAACGTSDACVDRGCDPISGCFTKDNTAECGVDELCVDRGCDVETGCFERDPVPLPTECTPTLGCRITAGGITPDGGVDTTDFADIVNAHFGGQVGAPCGCIGCFDSLDQIQGSWETSRKTRRGSFHALDFNSLVCGCDGVMDGKLCNPGDRELGPEPRPAPANLACFSGVGDFNPTNGKRTIRVAFRVEVEDRSEPAVGKVAPDDVYRIRIWIPTKDETAEDLANQACCTNVAPTGRAPDIDDGGNLIHGNIQIHPPTPHTDAGVCPVPNGSCQQ